MAEDGAEARRRARRDRRRSRRRQEILEAAAAALVAAGLDAFTVAAVADRADVSKASVYYYFDSREALLAALMAERFEAETEAMEEAVERAPTGVAALESLLRAYVDFHAQDYASFRLVQTWFLGAGPQPELLKERVYPLAQRLMDRLEARLLADREAGRLHPEAHPRRLANLAHHLAVGIVWVAGSMEAVGGSTRFPLEETTEEACATLRRAARPA